MKKKLLVACLAIIAFAVAPSLASANPILTQPTGTALGSGKAIKATNVGNIVFTSSTVTWECTTGILEGTLTNNTTGTGIKAEITSAKIGGPGATVPGAPEPECKDVGFVLGGLTVTPAVNLPWCLEAASATDTFTIRGGKCSDAPRAININLDVTNVGSCEYSRSGTAAGTLVTDGGGTSENTVALTNQAWVFSFGPFGCPSEVKLDMRFSLTSGGSAAFISS